LYVFSTKLNTQKHGCSGLARIIPVAEVARLIRFYSPNSRSIFDLQKNGTDAKRYAEHRAEFRAVVRAEGFADDCAVLRADSRADDDAESRAVVCADRYAVFRADIFICRSEIKFHRDRMRRSGFALIWRMLTAFMVKADDTE
jgi:hypothetical protein